MPAGRHDHHDILKYSKGTKIHLKRIAVKARHMPQEAAFHVDCIAAPRAGTTLPFPPAVLQAPIVATIQVDIGQSLLKQNKKRISQRQRGRITVGSGNSSSSSTTSSSTKSHMTSPPPRAPNHTFGSPLRRSAGRAEEEEEYAAIHGHRRVDVDEDVELERPSRRGKKRILAQLQAEEAPAPAEGDRERKRRIREDFEVAARRLQDMSALGPAHPCPLLVPTSSVFVDLQLTGN